jgi:hypothetical protein
LAVNGKPATLLHGPRFLGLLAIVRSAGPSRSFFSTPGGQLSTLEDRLPEQIILSSSQGDAAMSTPNRRKVRLHVESLEERCVPATFTVTNLLDDGSAGCLRRRIAQANANPASLDTIVFKTGLEGTIKLTTGELSITGNLVLAGPGSSKVTIDRLSTQWRRHRKL